MHNFFALIRRDLLLAYRQPADWLNPILFFLLILLLFPLAITPEPKKLMLMGPGILWICVLFANLLSIDSLFSSDFEDGTLERMIALPQSLTLLVMARLIAHWLIINLPLILLSLLMAHFFYIPFSANLIICLTLLLGTPVITFIGATGAALTVGLQSRAILLILIILPLYVPLLIFGAGAGNDALLNLPVVSQLGFLAAIFILALTFCPMAIAASLRIGMD